MCKAKKKKKKKKKEFSLKKNMSDNTTAPL